MVSENGQQGGEHRPVLVTGGGPAGLTGAYELAKRDPSTRPLVVEGGDIVGGIARTEQYKGYRFDIGGHRFFTKVKPVEAFWDEVMGEDMIDVPRSSRIYYQNKFYDYPLNLGNALKNLGMYESMRVALSFAKWKTFPSKEEENFEQWVSNRFGGRLYWHFFRTYTQKVWGIPPTEIRADWAAQRIKDLSLIKAVVNSLTGKAETSSLIKTFKYPRLGPGQMWERTAEKIEEMGGEVRMRTRATTVHRDGTRVTAVDLEDRDGNETTVAADQVLNSMPITELVRAMRPVAPDHVLQAAEGLKYRDFLIVTLVLDHADPFSDNWIYIHSPDVTVGRIQNFRAWSAAMLPNQDTASIGMEYFCHQGDGLWNSSNEELLELAKKELEQLGLAPASSVIDGTVIRQPKAYPVYDADYKRHVDTIREWLLTFENLQSVGRNGMHRYNNQDHSMLASMLAARNILGEEHDIWTVNVERSYHEDFVVDKERRNKREKGGVAAASAEG
ncbi:MAG: NAD(P)/FAD-dependent oxidoreductase [Planctomycetota bacterium]